MTEEIKTEIDKRIEEASRSCDNLDFRNAVRSDCFKAGAKFILEMPELKEVFKALEFYKSYSDCVEDCRSRSDSWVLKCNCGFVAKEREHRQALEKLKALGIVNG